MTKSATFAYICWMDREDERNRLSIKVLREKNDELKARIKELEQSDANLCPSGVPEQQPRALPDLGACDDCEPVRVLYQHRKRADAADDHPRFDRLKGQQAAGDAKEDLIIANKLLQEQLKSEKKKESLND